MELKDRFGAHWAAWDAHEAAGEDMRAYLSDASDETLLELLGGESARDRRYARDIVATELLNRLHRRRSRLPVGAEAVVSSATAARRAAQAGQASIHTAEELLRASGEEELGNAVSDSAYASLDASSHALEVAEAHAAEVKETLESRSAKPPPVDDLVDAAEKAAAAADRGKAITRKLERRMDAEDSKAGRAAGAAARSIHDAAHRALEAAKAAEKAAKDAERTS